MFYKVPVGSIKKLNYFDLRLRMPIIYWFDNLIVWVDKFIALTINFHHHMPMQNQSILNILLHNYLVILPSLYFIFLIFLSFFSFFLVLQFIRSHLILYKTSLHYSFFKFLYFSCLEKTSLTYVHNFYLRYLLYWNLYFAQVHLFRSQLTLLNKIYFSPLFLKDFNIYLDFDCYFVQFIFGRRNINGKKLSCHYFKYLYYIYLDFQAKTLGSLDIRIAPQYL